MAKEAATTSKKADADRRKRAATNAVNELGGRIIRALVHAHQVQVLNRGQVEAALSYRGIKWDKKALKPALRS